jgi:DNA-binding transcriptional ArsR family regulator
MTPEKLAPARPLMTENRTISEIAAILGISRPTLYRHLAEHGQHRTREDVRVTHSPRTSRRRPGSVTCGVLGQPGNQTQARYRWGRDRSGST